MKNSINKMINSLLNILGSNTESIYLYGSVVSNDYRHGWSDIDFVCFTKSMFTNSQAEELKMLRQTLLKKEPKNKYYRKFEGIIVPLDNFANNNFSKLVYWGTSGQSIKQEYNIDVFSKYEIIKYGKLIYGKEVRDQLKMPSHDELKDAIKKHYFSIREHAKTTDKSLYSCGWLLDISRCIYTLKHNDVISKTEAGKWALKNKICPVEKELKNALKIRKRPTRYIDKERIQQWLSSLGHSVQLYANVLQKELKL